MMGASFDIVVSAENNHYIAWQAMLFHYSCITKFGCSPIVVVHGEADQPLMEGFQILQKHGGRIQKAPNFRRAGRFEYAARNTAGTLSCVKSDADYLVLCDPDMIFLGPLPMSQFQLATDQISFDAVSYLTLQYDAYVYVVSASRRADVSLQTLRQSPISGGVPHIMPSGIREVVSHQWLKCIEYFEPETNQDSHHLDGQLPWLTTMWALVFAVHRLGLNPVITQFCTFNLEAHYRRPVANDPQSPKMLHYCYGDAEFDKRSFLDKRHAMNTVWQSQAKKGTVSRTLCAELRAAGKYYKLADTREV